VLREQGDKVSGDEKAAVESKLEELKSALAGSDVEAIKTATEGLMTASQSFTQRLYEQAAAESGSAATPPPGDAPADDEVVDAEIVDAEIVDEEQQ